MTITTLTSSTQPTWQSLGYTADAYEKWINGHGGIGGHPLNVTVCDDQGSPTQGAACARKAVADKDVAVVGGFTLTSGDAIVPILQSAGIAYLPGAALSTAETTSPDSFIVGASPIYATGLVAVAYQSGCKKVNAAIIEGAGTFIPLIKNAAKAYGHSISITTVPAASTDYSPQVSQSLSGGADCVVTLMGQANYGSWLSAWQQSGTKAKLFGLQGDLDAESVKGFPSSLTNGMVVVGSYPNIDVPAFADFREALKEYNPPTSEDYNGVPLGTWTAFTVFHSVASKAKGSLTAATFLAAMKSATSVPGTAGMMPPVNYTKPWTNGLKGYARQFDRSVVAQTIQNGQVVPAKTNPTFLDVTQAALGTGKIKGALGGL